MKNNYIVLPRSIRTELNTDPGTFGMSIQLLMIASNENLNVNGEFIEKGSINTTKPKLASYFKCSSSYVYTTLKKLQKLDFLELKSNKGSGILIKIKNFDSYLGITNV